MKNRLFIHDHVIPTCLVLAFVLASFPCHRALSQVILEGQEKIKLDVPYEPSSEEVVGAMLEIAQVGDTDVVYDLGCGDGRIVIAAAQKKGPAGWVLTSILSESRKVWRMPVRPTLLIEYSFFNKICSRRTSARRPWSCCIFGRKSI